MARLLFCLLLMASSFTSHGQSLTPVEQIARFSTAMSDPDFDQAIDLLFRNNEEAQFNNFDLAQWKDKLRTDGKTQLFNRGKHLGMEMIKEEVYSPSLQRLVYVEKFEQGFIFWQFYFYKPWDQWVIARFDVESDLAIAKEAMRF